MKKILVADQEEILCFLFQEELAEEGYDVVSLTSSEGILQEIVQENKPDLLLLSIEMVEQGLWRLFYEMRKSGYGIPIILLTTNPYSKGFPETLVNDTFVKNSNLDELKCMIKRILGEDKKPSFPKAPFVEGQEERRSEQQMSFSFQE